MLKNSNLQNPNKTDLILEALNTMSGDIVTFDGIGGMPLKKLTVNIEPVQEGTGDPSPDNVRPITGWRGMQVHHAYKNLYSGYELAKDLHNKFVNSTIDTGNKYVRFIASSDVVGNAYAPSSLQGKIKEKTVYTIVLTIEKTSGLGSNLRIYHTDGTYIQVPPVNTAAVKERKIIRTTQGKTFQTINKSNSSGYTLVYYDECALFEGNLTDEEVDAYFNPQPTIYDITFPSEAGTVYGGSLDVLNGILTVTHGYIAEYAGEELPGAWISSMDVYEEGAVPTTGAQVVYELAEPVIYQLNPEKVTALLGENNIWADSGDVVVQYGQYLSTLKEYIDAKVADLQAQIDSNEEVAP